MFGLSSFISVTPILFEEEDAMAFFCKTAASPCQFPFIWNGTTYTSCTRDGSEFDWCALEVDSERVVVDRRWGSCDMSTCTPAQDLAEDLTHGQSKVQAVFNDEVTGVVLFTQRSSTNPIELEGMA